MKPYVLFMNIKPDGCTLCRYGWKRYQTPENAIQAFKDLRKQNYMDWDIDNIAEIVGQGGAKTYYLDNVTEREGYCKTETLEVLS